MTGCVIKLNTRDLDTNTINMDTIRDQLLFSRSWKTVMGEFVITPDESLGLPLFSLTTPTGELYGSNRYRCDGPFGKVTGHVPSIIFESHLTVAGDSMGRIKICFSSGKHKLTTYMQKMPKRADEILITALLVRIHTLETRVAALEAPQRAPPMYPEGKEDQ